MYNYQCLYFEMIIIYVCMCIGTAAMEQVTKANVSAAEAARKHSTASVA